MTLLGWSKTLAREVGNDRITCNIVLHGRVATGRIQFLDEQKAKGEARPVADVTAESNAGIPVGRYGEPQEYADVVAFLASRNASYVTGSVIRLDGGLLVNICGRESTGFDDPSDLRRIALWPQGAHGDRNLLSGAVVDIHQRLTQVEGKHAANTS